MEGNQFMFKIVKAGPIGSMMAMGISATVSYASSNLSTYAPVGAGRAVNSGFVVSGVEYQKAVNPSQVEAVEFDLDRAASTVLSKLVSSAPNLIAHQNKSTFNGAAPALMLVRWPTWMNYASWPWLILGQTVAKEYDL